jgi:tRNA/tmRNA/rRNA uracil-C5-methylase (TrmA/RlmC/RlmD family)
MFVALVQRLIHNLQSRASRVAEQRQSPSLQGSPSDLQAETFLDLYTGIGYFSVPALVHTDIAHAHMCEWNPDAVEALRKNLEVNQIDPTRCRFVQFVW